MKRRLSILRRFTNAEALPAKSKRFRPARVALGLAVAGAAASTAFALAYLRKKHEDNTAELGIATGPTLLDKFMPLYEFRDSIKVRINASPREILAALETLTLADMPLAWLLGTMRYLPSILSGKTQLALPDAQPFSKQFTATGSGVLAQDAEREIVIGKLHQIRDQAMLRFKSAEEFMAFSDPAYQKLTISLRLEPGVLFGEHTLVLEHRTHALSEEARKQFAVYWLAIKPGGAFMSKLLLDAVKRRAERGAANKEPASTVPSDRSVAAAA